MRKFMPRWKNLTSNNNADRSSTSWLLPSCSMSHGVMLSDPPAPAGPNSSGTLLQKGVMLSLRPTSSVVDPGVSGHWTGGGPGAVPAPFITGGHCHEQIGYSPITNSAMILQRKRVLTMAPAMRKHRRWLDELRHERQRLEEERQQQQTMEAIRMRNFKERSAFVRRRICETIKGDGSELTADEAEKLFTAPLSELKKMQQEKRLQQQHQKPAWSLTEAEGEMVSRSQVEDLVQFASHLDITRYIDDLEIQQLVRSVQKRVATLNCDTNFATETEAARARRLASPDPSIGAPKSLNVVEGKLSVSDTVEDVTADVDGVEMLIDESLPNFKGVHSRMSLRNVIDSMERRSSCLETRDLDLSELPAPKIVQVDGNHVGRIPSEKQAAHVSTLPYLHRNPAV